MDQHQWIRLIPPVPVRNLPAMPRQRRQVPGGMVFRNRNPLRANRVSRPEDWTWRSLWRQRRNRGVAMLADSPVARAGDWIDFGNKPQTEIEQIDP